MLYDLQVDAASAREIDGGYEVAIELTAKQFAADGSGKDTEELMDTWFDVAVFAGTDKPLEGVTPLYIAKLPHLRSPAIAVAILPIQGAVQAHKIPKARARNGRAKAVGLCNESQHGKAAIALPQ